MKKLLEHEPYARASAKLTQLQIDLTAKERRLNELYSKISPAIARDPLQEAAQALLDGDAPAVNIPPRNDALRSEVARLQEERQILARAVELAKHRRDQAHAEASAAACRAVQGEHIKAVRAIVDCAVALARANAAEQAIRAEIEAAGFSAGALRHSQYPRVGKLADSSGFLVNYLRDLLETGFISLAEFKKYSAVELPPSLVERLKLAA